MIGTDKFVSSLPEPVHRTESTLSLEHLAEGICAEYEIDVDLLRSKSSARYLTPIRLHLLHRAVHERIATLAEVARFLYRNPSTFVRLAQRHPQKGK